MENNEDASANVSRMMNEVDTTIARHLMELSPVDREKSYSDIHGVSSDEIHETPLLVSQSLELMEQEINRIQNKADYSMAESINQDYVRNPDLRLKFLRGERFNVCRAAHKMVKHFELKRSLFGVSRLVKNIEQEDLSEEDIEVLYSGYAQWLPQKDSSHRTVFIIFPLMSSKHVPVLPRVSDPFHGIVNFSRTSLYVVVLIFALVNLS